jgi:hypothetical protein
VDRQLTLSGAPAAYLLVVTEAQHYRSGAPLGGVVVSAERGALHTCPLLWPGAVGPCGPGVLWAWERPPDNAEPGGQWRAGPAVLPLVQLGWTIVAADTRRRSEVCQRLSRAGWPVRYRGRGGGLRRYETPATIDRPRDARNAAGSNPRTREVHRGTTEG